MWCVVAQHSAFSYPCLPIFCPVHDLPLWQGSPRGYGMVTGIRVSLFAKHERFRIGTIPVSCHESAP